MGNLLTVDEQRRKLELVAEDGEEDLGGEDHAAPRAAYAIEPGDDRGDERPQRRKRGQG